MSDPKQRRPFLTAPAVIDWLQWGTFPERLDEPDYPRIALRLIAEYKAEIKKRDARIAELQAKLEIAVKFLKEGKAKFAPNTTNSFVDEFIKDHEAKQAAKIEEVKE